MVLNMKEDSIIFELEIEINVLSNENNEVVLFVS
jgi:hypothetical protein